LLLGRASHELLRRTCRRKALGVPVFRFGCFGTIDELCCRGRVRLYT
jgi:hypothetical protein